MTTRLFLCIFTDITPHTERNFAMTPTTRDRIITILSHLAGAYGGASQYDMSDVGTALYRQRRNGLLEGSDHELAGIAAAILYSEWQWEDDHRDQRYDLILDAMCWEAAEDAEKAAREARSNIRKPLTVSEADPDFQRLMCQKIVANLQSVIGADMEAHPRIVGMALASAIEDGDAENYPEALADHASSVIWPTRHDDGFPATMEAACLQWIEQAAAACKASM
jgi:hypothetical protein